MANDKRKLLEYVAENIDEDYVEAANKLKELINAFLIGEFLKGNPYFRIIDEVMRTLKGSKFEKAKHHPIKTLFK